jgi:hypothetical protein
MFKLKRPCANCPFRRGQGELFALHPRRLREIVEAVAFQCHGTVDYSGDKPASGEKPQQCAGLMAVLWRDRQPNQIMKVAMAFRDLDPTTLDPDGEAYGSVDEAMAAHAKYA